MPYNKENTLYNIETEQAVLGSMLIEPSSVYIAMEILQTDDFFDMPHQIIYDTMMAMAEAGQAIDLATVAEELQRRGLLKKVGGRMYIASLTTGVVTSGNIEHHARIIKNKSLARKIRNYAETLKAKSETEDGIELIETAASELLRIDEGNKSNKPKEIKDLLPKVYETMEYMKQHPNHKLGLETGFKDLDEFTGGLFNGEYTILAARTSFGKTTMGFQIAENVAVRHPDKDVLYYTIEMTAEKLAYRLAAQSIGISSQQIRTGRFSKDDLKRLGDQLPTLAKIPVKILDDPRYSEEIIYSAKRHAIRKPISLIVIDYIQELKMRGRQDTRNYELERISGDFKQLAKELNIPILVLSQLNRDFEKRVNKRPNKSDLRDCGSLEQDVDMILLIHRPDQYVNDNETDKHNQIFKQVKVKGRKIESDNVVELIVEKNRNGQTGSVFFRFDDNTATFQELEPVEAPYQYKED